MICKSSHYLPNDMQVRIGFEWEMRVFENQGGFLLSLCCESVVRIKLRNLQKLSVATVAFIDISMTHFLDF